MLLYHWIVLVTCAIAPLYGMKRDTPDEIDNDKVTKEIKLEQDTLNQELFKVLEQEQEEIACSTIRKLIQRGANTNAYNAQGDTPLIVAIKKGYKDLIMLLLAKGAENNNNSKNESPLMYAVYQGHIGLVYALIEASTDKQAAEQDALCAAAKSNQIALLKSLIDNGISINKQNALTGATALIIAASKGYKEAVDHLLAHGADCTLKLKDGNSALTLAAQAGHKEIVFTLLDKWPSESKNQILISALLSASYTKQEDLVELLIKRSSNKAEALDIVLAGAASGGHLSFVTKLIIQGPSLEARDHALVAAAKNGHQEVVQKLLESGARSNAQLSNGFTALTAAITGGHKQIALFLLDQGAYPCLQNNKGPLPLVRATQRGYSDVVIQLIKKGAKVSEQEPTTGTTALLEAIKHRNEEIIQILLAHKVDYAQKDKAGNNALSLAAQLGNMTLVNIFVELYEDKDEAYKIVVMGAICGEQQHVLEKFLKNIHIDALLPNGYTPLKFAAYKGSKDCVKLILDNGADIDKAEEINRTALMYAAQQGHKETVAFLLEHNAQHTIGTPGQQALNFAAAAGHEDIVDMLINKEANKDKARESAFISAARGGKKNLLSKFLLFPISQAIKDTALFNAASSGFKDVVQILFEAGAYVDANSRGESALISALKIGHKEVAELLIQLGASVNGQNSFGQTSLMHAVQRNFSDLVSLLLKKGANINARDRHGDTAIMKAAAHGFEDMVLLLLSKSNDHHTACNDAFLSAASTGHLSLTTTLLKNDITGEAKKNALIKAVASGHQEIVTMLLERHVAINTQDTEGNSLVMIACNHKKKEIVQLLIKAGAPLNLVNDGGERVHTAAVRSGSKELVELLLTHDTCLYTNDNERIAILLDAISSNSLELIQFLLPYIGTVNVPEGSEDVPLINAARSKNLEIVKLLLEQGALVNTRNNKGNTALHIAAKNGNFELVKLLVERGAEVNAQNKKGYTALTSFTRQHEFTDIALFLLANGAQATLPNKDERTVLHHLAFKKDENSTQLSQLVKELLLSGVSINAQDSTGATPLMLAAQQENEAIVNLFLQNGATCTNEDNNKRSSLTLAAKAGCYSIVEMLLKQMKEHSQLIKSQLDASLLVAAKYGYSAIVKLLLHYGAYKDAQKSYGSTSLLLAAQNNHSDVVEILLNHGATMEIRNKQNWDPLTRAAADGHLDIAIKLLDASKNREEALNNALLNAAWNGQIPIVNKLIELGAPPSLREDALLRRAGDRNGFTVVQLLIEAGAHINSTNRAGQTALMIAAKSGCTETVKYLVEKGAAIELLSFNGKTALILASEAGHKDIETYLVERYENREAAVSELLLGASKRGDEEAVQQLLQLGANIEVRTHRGTPLIFAVKNKHIGLVRILLKNKALVNARDNNGKTALIYAIESNSKELIKLLLDAGADLRTLDNAQNTPLHTAASTGSREMVDFLIEKGAQVNVTNITRQSPQTLAIENGHVALIGKLLSASTLPVATLAEDAHLTNKLSTAVIHYLTSDKATRFIKMYQKEQYEELGVLADILQFRNINNYLKNPVHYIEQMLTNKLYKEDLNQTALMWACIFDHTNIVETLVSAKELPSGYIHARDCRGRTALMYALIYRNSACAYTLIPHCAKEIDAQDREGNTALSLAAQYGNKELINLLLAAGARPSVRAIKRAAELGHTQIAVKLLALMSEYARGHAYQGLPGCFPALFK